RPKVAIFIKYEFWYNFLKELALEHIPVYFVAVRFRPKQYFFRFYGSWFVGHLKTVSGFFVQNEISKQCLYKVGINQVWVSGDTRFDRVLKIKESKEDFPWIASFAQQKRLIIAGSSWPNDEKLLKLYLEKQGLGCRLILVPHEIHLSRLDAVLKEFQSLGAVLYSSVKKGEIDASHFERVKVLIIDEVGILSKIYRYADIAYIGGGFGKGIHNVLEAAVYGIPVLFGPNYGKFGEALDLISCGGAFSVANEEELEYRLNSLKDPSLWKISSAKAEEYVSSHDGAVEIVLKQMSSEL
ncbi:MAG: glycosyltransferase N-terminal domain-containing protein, partial [Bacteroidales bacterium]